MLKPYNLKKTCTRQIWEAIPSVADFSESLMSDVKSNTKISKNFSASNFIPTEPPFKIK